LILKVEEPRFIGKHRWVCSFMGPNGTIYLPGRQKSVDGGITVVPCDDPALQLLYDDEDFIFNKPEGAVLCKPSFFLGLDGPIHYYSPGRYYVKAWRSTDNLKTVKSEEASIYIPGGPKRERKKGEWFGLYVCRNIVELPDGTLLATVEGNFESDQIIPTDYSSMYETPVKCRSIIIASEDGGKTWFYRSTIAAPRPEDPVGEGFGEPTMVLLDDGRLLCIMRTGHFYPLYACWSSDGGRTWTEPTYTGLERGCFPCLIKLLDGRLALAYGKRFPEGWSKITPEGDALRWKPEKSEGLVKLAISPDGTGEKWVETTIGSKMGSCYPTIIEVEPNLIFCQVDGWIWRVKLSPKI
jgi:hypothetical protein